MGMSVCNAVSRTQFTQNPWHACYGAAAGTTVGVRCRSALPSAATRSRICLKKFIYVTEIAWLLSAWARLSGYDTWVEGRRMLSELGLWGRPCINEPP
jgi:hypothetical protein